MSQRQEFIRHYGTRRYTVAELCHGFGISEKTGYKWLRRFAAEGLAGLADRSHVPHIAPHQLVPALAEQILALRGAHPTWGPRKLHQRLRVLEPERPWPVPSTIGALLQRHGLVRPRRRAHRWAPVDLPLSQPAAPNDVWTADFKGEFRLRTGAYCYPLTVADAYSRFLLGCTGATTTASARAARVFRRLFQTYGLPRVIRTDNGVPFASPLALGRLSPLAVWWIRLGIRPERIAPGQPQQNGQHERMHRTLKAEATRPASPSAPAQQARFDHFRAEYNTERPHEALQLQTPASRYVASPRRYPRTVPEPEYPAHVQVQRVRQNGLIKWRDHLVFLSSVLVGEPIGIEETSSTESQIRFGPLVLGTFDETRTTFVPGLYWLCSD
jgi:transposase InsO family protein